MGWPHLQKNADYSFCNFENTLIPSPRVKTKANKNYSKKLRFAYSINFNTKSFINELLDEDLFVLLAKQ